MYLHRHTIRIPPALINFTNMEATAKKDLIAKAKEVEQSQEFEQAAEIYEQVLKKDALEAEAYDRLMIVYRKLKEYQKELEVIDRGIAAFEDHYKSKVSTTKKVIEISK
jgi:tetratricopeptide (TPR) repeat protein